MSYGRTSETFCKGHDIHLKFVEGHPPFPLLLCFYGDHTTMGGVRSLECGPRVCRATWVVVDIMEPPST